MKNSLLVVVVLLINFSCAQKAANHITEFNPNDIGDAILVDVRTPEEYEQGHIEKSVNINWFDPEFANKFDAIDKQKTIYVYCKVGGRSAKAQQRLTALGFKNVINLEGGYDAWVKK